MGDIVPQSQPTSLSQTKCVKRSVSGSNQRVVSRRGDGYSPRTAHITLTETLNPLRSYFLRRNIRSISHSQSAMVSLSKREDFTAVSGSTALCSCFFLVFQLQIL